MSDVQHIQNVLIVSTSWIGDAVMSIPTICGVRSLFPRARIAVLAKSGIADLYRAVPTVDEIIPYDKQKGFGRIATITSAVRALRKQKFELAVIFPRSVSTALIPLLAGIPRRIGFSTGLRGLLLTEALTRDAGLRAQHQTHYYKRLLEPIGAADYPELPRLTVPDEAVSWANALLRNEGHPHGGPLIGINPGSTYGEAKQWLPERFAELARRRSEAGSTIVVFGDAATRPLAKTIAKTISGRAIDATGRTTIMQLAALIGRCSVLVTNDTGPMHVGCAVGTPVVAIFGSTNRTTTAPADPSAKMVTAALPCSPCMQRVCPEGHHECMQAVTVDMVEAAVQQQLSAYR